MAPHRTHRQRRLTLVVLALFALLVALTLTQLRPAVSPPPGQAAGRSPAGAAAAYAGSQTCRECHENAFNQWTGSHHALAERAVDPVADKPAFDPPRDIKHATQTSRAQCSDGRFELVTRGADGAPKPYVPERVIGVNPLRQFLIPAPGGRFQVTELAVASDKQDWFDVFGKEDRQPGEWGHWSGRGMTWNSMCAECHNTRLRKNYQPASDSYATAMAERGVGCEACHGPLADHVAWQKARTPVGGTLSPANGPTGVSGLPGQAPRPRDPTVARFTGDQYISVCGGCHARRSNLTGDFVPGDQFLDHYAPTIPDETDIYYPDGQVRDEDFEYVSFLGSRMYGLGVRCLHCHDAHTGKTRAAGNALCLQCHGGKIDPAAHGRHKPDTPGSFCVDCHMPQTPYMQRHLRRDHGLTIPDPLLTNEHGIPNACSRCHADKGLDWNIDYAQQWYGNRLERSTRIRARRVARARAGAEDACTGLLAMLRDEQNPFWKAVAAGLLAGFCARDDVRDVLQAGTQDPAPLLRAVSARALSSRVAQPRVRVTFLRLLQDPVRMVRVEAAWALHADPNLPALADQDLMRFLQYNADQPAGAWQLGVLNLDRGKTDSALAWLKQAVTWDTHSPQLRQAYATALSVAGDSAEAVRQLRKACETEPRNPTLWYSLGLALGETKEFEQALRAFKEAVKLEPSFTRAWYNLGLAYSKVGDMPEALNALKHAEALDKTCADYPYARATVHFNMGQAAEARDAATRTLKLDAAHEGATELLRQLEEKKQ